MILSWHEQRKTWSEGKISAPLLAEAKRTRRSKLEVAEDEINTLVWAERLLFSSITLIVFAF
jgi:hypothetical protein